MNERLEKCVKEAGGIGYDDDGNEIVTALIGSEVEKFAELIVRECRPWLADDAFQEIKKHFGIEQ